MRKVTKTGLAKDVAFNRVAHDPPDRVKVTERRHGKAAARAMATAIALDEARKAGVRIPKK